MKREYNRDFERITQLRDWCNENGKKLFGLANSGCLNNCSVHNFHDNLVAHENDISVMDNAYDFRGKCWEYLSKGDNAKYLIRNTNFIRPEDVHLYEGLFDGLKLATRINTAPIKVINAYVSGKFFGGIKIYKTPYKTIHCFIGFDKVNHLYFLTSVIFNRSVGLFAYSVNIFTFRKVVITDTAQFQKFRQRAESISFSIKYRQSTA